MTYRKNSHNKGDVNYQIDTGNRVNTVTDFGPSDKQSMSDSYLLFLQNL